MSNRKIIKGIFHVFSIGTRYWLKPISLQERQSNRKGRVITYVKRATRNYPVMFGNVANGDILIYCVLTFHDYYRGPRLLFWLRRFRRINIKVNLLSRLRRFWYDIERFWVITTVYRISIIPPEVVIVIHFVGFRRKSIHWAE